MTGTTDIMHGTEVRWPGIGLHELFEAQARRTPAAPAVIADDEVISYSELDGQANRLAHHLLDQGTGVESRVAVCMRRSPGLVVTLLAVLKAGAVYVPLDPSYPAERAALMLTDSAATLLVTDASAPPRPIPDQVRVVPYSPDVIQNEPVTRPETVLDGDNLAYVFFTSGSTGQPKAVMTSHRAIRNHTVWFQETFQLDARDRLLHKTPIGFDPSVTEFMAPLIAGGQLVLAPDHTHRDPAFLVNMVIEKEITVLQVVPTLLALLLDQRRLPECRSLRLLVCGGEALPTDLVARARALLPARVHNLYGPTETAIDVTWLDATEMTDGHIAPIGRPITGTRMHVLDADLRPVPPGETGELYVGGVALARGYLGRPDLTADRFVPDPFSTSNRLYRTGDLGRCLPDGAVEFAGRADQQLKVHGVRVEPGEIEALLREHPAVDDAAVVAQADATGDDRLVAYVAAQGHESRELPEEIHAYLAGRLPGYLVPAAVNVRDALPRTTSGKLDRRALSEFRGGVGTLATAEFVAPRTPLEKEIADAFARLLGVERIGINDRLFDTGLDSLTVARLGTHVMNTYDVNFPLSLLFSVPTVAGVAEAVENYVSHGDKNAVTRYTSMIKAEAQLSPDLVPDWKDE